MHRVKLLDFGLARPVASADKLTHSGYVVGTPSYMAPEQAMGEAVDARADLFSLGCVLYRLATGEAPFAGKDSVAILLAAARHAPVPVRRRNAEVPAELATLIERLLAKKPAQRPASAQEVAQLLAALSQIAAEHTPELTGLPRRSSRRGWVAATLVSLAAVAAALLWPHFAFEPPSVELTAATQQATPAKPSSLERSVPLHTASAKASSREQPPSQPAAGPPLPPLRRDAIVQRPAPLPGVQSWTVEVDSIRRSSTRIPVSFCATEPLIATGSEYGVIHIWHAETGRLVRCLISPEKSELMDLAWSPNGQLLASCTADRLLLWELATGKLLRSAASNVSSHFHGQMYRSVLAWSPDSALLAQLGGRQDVLVHEARSGKLAWKYQPPREKPADIHMLAWSKDGKHLAVGTVPWVILVDTATGLESSRTAEMKRAIVAMAFAPDSRALVIVLERSERPLVWDIEARKEREPLEKLPGRVTWSPDGKYLACSGKVVAAATGATVANLARLPQFTFVHDFYCHSWSADSRLLAYTGSNGTVRVLRLPGAEETILVPQVADLRTTRLEWSPDGAWLAGSGENILWLYDGRQGKQLRHFGPLSSSAARWLPDSSALLHADASPTNRPWYMPRAPLEGSPLIRLTPEVRRGELAIAPDGKQYAHWERGADKIAVRDIDKHQVLRQLPLEPAKIKDYLPPLFAWTQDNLLVTFDERSLNVLRWQMPQGTPLPAIPMQPQPYSYEGLALAPNGATLALYEDHHPPGLPRKQRLLLLDLATGKQRSYVADPLESHPPPAWSPCNRWLAVPRLEQLDGLDRQYHVDIVDAATGQQVRSFRVPQTLSGRLSWGPTGDVLAVCLGGTYEGCLELWSPQAGTQRGTLICLGDQRAVFVSPEGHYRGTPGIEAQLRYVLQTEAGQETLTVEEFAHRFGWRNDPARVQLAGE